MEENRHSTETEVCDRRREHQLFKASLRRSSLERERAVGTEGEREMGVFLRDTLLSMSQMVENGIRFLGSICQQSQTRSYGGEGGGVRP